MSTIEFHNVTKSYNQTTALDDVSLSIPRGSVVGLIGRNGCGKTTLLHHVTGLVLPDRGRCITLGQPADQLDDARLARIGLVPQQPKFVKWMTVDQQIEYVRSFYPTWDAALEIHLVELLELDRKANVGGLSPGNVQKLAVVTALCPRPDLLLLDEPVASMDPVVRDRTLRVLLDLMGNGERTILVSSHILHDIERLVNHVVCMEAGRVKVSASLDDLQERYAEWRVVSRDGKLPESYDEEYVVRYVGSRHQATLIVCDANGHRTTFGARYGVEVEERPLNLERLFPLFLEPGRKPAEGVGTNPPGASR